MKPTVLPICLDYLSLEFILNKDEGDIASLHPYLEKRVALSDPITHKRIPVEPKLVQDALDRLAEQKIIEIKDGKYVGLTDKRQALNALYEQWDKDWTALVNGQKA